MSLRDLFNANAEPEVVTITLVDGSLPFQAQVEAIRRTRDGLPIAVHVRTQTELLLIPWSSVQSLRQPRG